MRACSSLTARACEIVNPMNDVRIPVFRYLFSLLVYADYTRSEICDDDDDDACFDECFVIAVHMSYYIPNMSPIPSQSAIRYNLQMPAHSTVS